MLLFWEGKTNNFLILFVFFILKLYFTFKATLSLLLSLFLALSRSLSLHLFSLLFHYLSPIGSVCTCLFFLSANTMLTSSSPALLLRVRRLHRMTRGCVCVYACMCVRACQRLRLGHAVPLCASPSSALPRVTASTPPTGTIIMGFDCQSFRPAVIDESNIYSLTCAL